MSMRDYESVLDTCRKCADCPAVAESLRASALIKRNIKEQMDGILDPSMEELVADNYDGFSEFVTTTLGVPSDELFSSPEDLMIKARQSTAKLADIAEATIDELLGDAEAMAQGCEGPLTLRAVSQGIEYRTKVCRSPAIPSNDDYKIEPTPVRRRKISD